MKHRNQRTFAALVCLMQVVISGCGGSSNPPANPADTTPHSFVFVDQTGVPLSTAIQSNSITVTGIDSPSPISVSGGEYAIDGGTFTAATGSVINGQSIVVRMMSAPAVSTTVDATLDIGGVTDTFSVTTLARLPTSSASILFPPRRSLTGATTASVRGLANDDVSEIAAVRINGIAASTNDGFATWSAVVPLTHGENILVVEVEDTEQIVNANADQILINRSSNPFNNPTDLVVDAVNYRALVLDRPDEDTIFAVDLSTGERTVFSSDSYPNSDDPFFFLTAAALDEAGNRLLVVSDDLMAVDLSTGVRTLLSTNIGGLGIRELATDSGNNRALLLGNAVYSADLTSGVVTTLSDNVTPSGANPFSYPTSIAIDAPNNRALVVDIALNAVLAVDLNSGTRTILSNNTTPNSSVPFVAASGVAPDSNSNRAFILDQGLGALAIKTVDLSTGSRSILSSETMPDANTPFRNPRSIALDHVNGRALVTEGGLGASAVYAVDLATGERSVLSGSSTPDGTNWLVEANAIAIDSLGRRALIIDRRYDQSVLRFRHAVFAVDLDSGTRTILSDDTVQNASNPLFQPEAIVLHESDGRALVADFLLRTVFSIDLASGQRTVFSDDLTPVSSVNFSQPIAMALDQANDRVLVVDGGNRAVLAADLATGSRSVFVDSATLTGGNASSFPSGIAIDIAGNRALVLDNGLNAVYELDLDNGTRRVLSDDTTPNGDNPLRTAMGISIDETRNRAIVADQGEGLIAIDLDTGSRTILSNDSVPNSSNPFSFPRAIAMDTQSDIIIVVDQEETSVVAVDPVTGERVILSQD